jgi:hypothetical protein
VTAGGDRAPRIAFAWWETLAMRAGFALLLWYEYPRLSQLPPPGDGLPFPHALAAWIDLTWALEPDLFRILRLVLLAACGGYVAGVAVPFATLALLACYLVAGTLRNSLGAIGHAYQLITLVLLVQTVVAWWWCLSGRAALLRRAPPALQASAARATLQIVAASYVLAAITKLITSQGTWMLATRFVPVQAEKTRWQTFHNTLQMPEPGLGAALNGLCLEQQWFCVLFYGPGLLVELFAFVMLFGRGWALASGVALLAMHQLITVTMGLNFRQHEAIVLLYAVNLPYWAMHALGWLRRR